MGSFGTAFLKTTADAANKRFAEKTAEDTKIKDAQRESDWKIAFDTTGQWDEPTRKAAMDRYVKSLPPSLRKNFEKFQNIYQPIQKIVGAQGGQGQQPPAQGQPQPGTQPSPAGKLAGPSTPPPATAGGNLPGGPTVENAAKPPQPAAAVAQPQTPKPSPAATPAMTGPKTPPPQAAQPMQLPQRDEGMLDAQAQADERRKLAATKQEQDFWTEQGKKLLGADASPRDLAEYAGSKGTKLPAVAQVKMTPVQLDMTDGGKISAMRSTDGKYYDLRGNLLDGDAVKAESAKASAAAPRFSGDKVTQESFETRLEKGEKFKRADGEELKKGDVLQGEGLQPVGMNGEIRYIVADLPQVSTDAGNERFVTDRYHKANISTGGPGVTDLGQVKTGSQNTPTSVDMVDGVPVVKGSTSTPNTPGPRRAPGASPATPATQTGGNGLSAPATPAPQSSGGGKTITGLTPGMFKDATNTARSVQQALTQVVGDDDNPNLKTVVSLAPDILKDKVKTERVGKAIRMMLGGDSGLEGAHVSTGASIGPVSVGVGGFGEFLKQSLNMDAKVADKINQNLAAAMKDMTPEEKSLVDSTVAAFEESIAMRSINKSGVSNAQVGAIQNTLPLVGANTFSVDEFATRMQNWAQQGLNGKWGVPSQMFRPGFLNRLKGVSDDMEKLRSKGQPSPKAKASLPPKVGTVEGGYKFKGGDPANKNNWEKVN